MTVTSSELDPEYHESNDRLEQVMLDVSDKIDSGELTKSEACQYLAYAFGRRELTRAEVNEIAERLQLLEK